MKKQFSILLLLVALPIGRLVAQNTWTEKTSLPVFELQSSTSFSIGNNGYVVTGIDGSGTGSAKLWEYDQATDTWIAKADFPGATRTNAVAFSIGTKGYVGTGTGVASGSELRDFWEWDQLTNTWSQKANFGGTPRKFCAAFSVNGKGYIGTGWDNTMNLKKDFWEYNPTTDVWTTKADFPSERYGASSFSINNKGYICSGGIPSGSNFPNDLQEYDPVTDTWTEKAPLPASGATSGVGRDMAFAFSIGNKGFIGAGTYVDINVGFLPVYCQDFWEYDQLSNTWTQRPDFGGGERQWAFGFSIGNKGYAGSGERVQFVSHDLWEFGSTSSVGITENTMSTITCSIYPNPSNGEMTVVVPESGEYAVYDALGQMLFSLYLTKNDEQLVDLKNLSSGVYSLRFVDYPTTGQRFQVIR